MIHTYGEMIVEWNYKVGTGREDLDDAVECVVMELEVDGQTITLAMRPSDAAHLARDLVDQARSIVHPQGD
jgi:hypothetical protein